MKVKYRGQYSHSVISKLPISFSFVVTPLSVSVTNVDNFELLITTREQELLHNKVDVDRICQTIFFF